MHNATFALNQTSRALLYIHKSKSLHKFITIYYFMLRVKQFTATKIFPVFFAYQGIYIVICLYLYSFLKPLKSNSAAF